MINAIKNYWWRPLADFAGVRRAETPRDRLKIALTVALAGILTILFAWVTWGALSGLFDVFLTAAVFYGWFNTNAPFAVFFDWIGAPFHIIAISTLIISLILSLAFVPILLVRSLAKPRGEFTGFFLAIPLSSIVGLAMNTWWASDNDDIIILTIAGIFALAIAAFTLWRIRQLYRSIKLRVSLWAVNLMVLLLMAIGMGRVVRLPYEFIENWFDPWYL